MNAINDVNFIILVFTETKMCRFYNDTKRVGEEFEPEPVDMWTVDLKCKCEVPPFITCQRSMAVPVDDGSGENF